MAPVKSTTGKEATAQLTAGGPARFPGEDEMCQLVEVKQEPLFVSNTFFKQVRGSWVVTQLKGISLSLSRKPNPEDFLPLSEQNFFPTLP